MTTTRDLTHEPSHQADMLVALVRQDTAFASLPVFVLNEDERRRKSALIFKTDLTLNGVPGSFKWQVSADPTYGFPDGFDRKVFKALEALILENKPPLTNPIYFSLYRILQVLGLPPFGVHFTRVRASIQRIASVKIHAQFVGTEGEIAQHQSESFHLFDDVTFQEESFDSELGAGNHKLTLGAWYLEMLNRGIVRPTDLEPVQAIQNSIASRLYELLTIKFRDVLANRQKGWEVDYATLCRLLPIREVSWMSSPKRQFDEVHDELIAGDIIDRVEWSKTAQGWTILYVPGRRMYELYARPESPEDAAEAPSSEKDRMPAAEPDAGDRDVAAAVSLTEDDKEKTPLDRLTDEPSEEDMAATSEALPAEAVIEAALPAMEEPPPQEEEPPAQEAVIEAALPAMEEPPPQEEEPPAQDAVIEAALPATEESLDTGTPPKPDTPDGMILSVQDAVPQPSESILEPEPSPEPRFDEAEAVSPEMAAPEADRASTEPDAEPLWPPSDQTPPEEKGLEDSAPSASETHAWPFVSSQLNYRALLERGAAMPAQPNGETHCDIRYLLAWTTRSRDKILNRDIAMRTRQLIREVCVIHEAKIVRGMVAPDYVQLEVVCPPTVTPSALADDLKDRTLSVLQEEFPELKRQYWGLPLWSGGYICLSTGDNTVQDQLRAYLDAKQPMDDESFQVISAS